MDPSQRFAGMTPQRLPVGGRADPVAGDQDRGITDFAGDVAGRGGDRPWQLGKVPHQPNDRLVGAEGIEDSLHGVHLPEGAFTLLAAAAGLPKFLAFPPGGD